MIRINCAIALPEDLDAKIRAISADTNVMLDLSNPGTYKVTVKCKIGKEIYGAMAKTLDVTPDTVVSLIDECIDTILELRNTGNVVEKVTSLSEDYMSIDLAEAIRIDRKKRKMSLEEYGRVLGIPASSLSHYENGNYKPRDLSLIKRIVDFTRNKAI